MVVHSVFQSTGGAEIQAKRLALSLQSRGWYVRVVGLRPRHESNSARRELPVHMLRTVPIPGVAGLLLMFTLARYLIKHRSEYDAIHVHIMKTMAFVAGITGKLLRKRVIVKVSGYDELDNGSLNPRLANRPKNRIINWGCRKASAIIAISRLTERRLRECGYTEDQIVYLPNGIDVKRFRPAEDKRARKNIMSLESLRTGVFVGRLVHEKGLFDLCDAWRFVRKAHLDAVLLIVGDGHLRPALQALVEADPVLRESVRIVGETQEVEKYLSVADCYVSASLTEGLSNTMLEAMASGLPIVSTAVSGAEDMIEPERNGFIVSIGDSLSLAKAVSKIFSDDALARSMGQRSREIALAKFNIENVISQYEHLYCGN